MRFVSTQLEGSWLVESEKLVDERGYFARLRCSSEFASRGIPETFVQTNLSYNDRKGTFRGLHYQVPPSKEGKLVRCVQGELFDVIADLRPGSPSFLKHQWFRLGSDKLSALWVPAGFAHGFLTNADDTVVLYEMSDYYAPDLGRGIRWDDPALKIALPEEIHSINERDSAYDDLDVETLSCFSVVVPSTSGER